jgi:branched-chain amino acid transport system ATP-binding protein
VALLELKELRVFYGSIEALKGISIEVNAGETVAMLGSNGAGKTTTLKTISGLLRPRSGSILFNGESIVGRPAHEVVGLGLSQVPEGRRIFTVLTVEENLGLGGYLMRSHRDVLRRRRDHVYELFPRLAERRRQLAGTLSGGEQQMLAIGRALMSEPKLLMLDEPSLGLSPLLSKLLLKIVRQVANQGTAVLLVEQNARQALAISDRAYVIETGSIALSGKASLLAEDARVQKAYLGGYQAVGT